jgi:hypothetical protein
MATTQPALNERLARLTGEIAEAQAELAGRHDFAGDDIGGLLREINEEVGAISHDDPDDAHARYDAVEARLAEARARLTALRR